MQGVGFVVSGTTERICPDYGTVFIEPDDKSIASSPGNELEFAKPGRSFKCTGGKDPALSVVGKGVRMIVGISSHIYHP